MPRPGPRPYECVRRAWHSDRHQPLRGSLIQDIFRIAHEIHSPATKKKKEWQEKLPIVVLKAEEIMYSKANSEDEYMDHKTLWDRTNDAINTIIRRDEGTEGTGEFLQPCIEAALHLGCIPRRPSRSQRNNHPRCYLSGNIDVTGAAEGNPQFSSSLAPQYTDFLGKEQQVFAVANRSCLHNEMIFLSGRTCSPAEGSAPSKSCPVYPLYCSVYSQPNVPQPNLGNLHTSNSTANSDKGGNQMGMSQILSLSNDDHKINKQDPPDVSKDQTVVECDLSLRLGFGSMQMDKHASLRESEQRRCFKAPKQELKDRFSLYCGNNAGLGGEIMDSDMLVRKRKAVEQMTGQRYPWQPKLMSAYSKEGARTAGL